jgi:hypothetical protein
MASIFTPEEQRIRRRWVTTLMWMIPYGIVITGLTSLISPRPLPFFAFIVFFQLGLTLLLYNFTYKKNGHRLLFTSLFLTLSSLPQIFSQNNPFSIVSTQAELIAVMVMLVIMLAIWAWWAFVSFKLIEVHRSLKPSRKCKKAMAPLQNAQTLQDLDQQFRILKDQFPKCGRALQAAYQTKKGSLPATP